MKFLAHILKAKGTRQGIRIGVGHCAGRYIWICWVIIPRKFGIYLDFIIE